MKNLHHRVLKTLVRLAIRQAIWISLIGTSLAGLGVFYTYRLYQNLRTNIEELLPSNARSVTDLKRLGDRLPSVENIVVLTFSSQPAASKRFVADLADKLEKDSSGMVAGVEYRINKELEFFQSRMPLFVELGDLRALQKYIKAKVSYEKSKLEFLNFGLPRTEPTFDFESLRKKYSSNVSFYERFPDGYYATPDQSVRAVIVNLAGKASDIEATLRFKQIIEQTVQSLNPKSYAPDLEIKYTGNLQNLIEEHSALIADLKFATVAVVFLVIGAMLFFYRAFWATGALVFSLFMGTFWTFGIAYFVTGYLNANSAFLASIVIGNGINFGIILLARYLEERRKGRASTRAIAIAIHQTSAATFTAALAAGLSYGSLMLTGFRGFNQFGVIGLMGMVLCWISAYSLLPSYLVLLEKWRPLVRKNTKPPRAILAGSVATLVGRHPKIISGASVVLTFLAFLTFFIHQPQILELDMNKLRDRTSMQSGSGFYYHYINEIFGRNLSPMVLLTESRDQVRKTVRLLKKKKQENAASQIDSIQSMDDFVPPDQEKKLKVFAELRALLKPSVVRALSSDEKTWADMLAATAELRPFNEAQLPALILNKFRETNGAVGRIVLVDKRVVGTGMAESALDTIDFVKDLRSTADLVGTNTAIAGQLPITADMISAILEDGPKATLFACLAVFLLIVVLFRSARLVALVSFALWMGMIWLAGLILGANFRLNFLNFIALPITLGIGVDYGVNVFQRYREQGRKDILDVIRYTGGAVGLCSLTTIIGYSSLLIAGNQAFVSFGRLAVLGEVCCIVAALFSLPAYLILRLRAQMRAGRLQDTV